MFTHVAPTDAMFDKFFNALNEQDLDSLANISDKKEGFERYETKDKAELFLRHNRNSEISNHAEKFSRN